MKIVLKNIIGDSVSFDVNPKDTFYDLKTRIQNDSGVELDLDQLNLRGKKVTDDQVVSQFFFEGVPTAAVMINKATSDMNLCSCCVPGCNNTKDGSPEKYFFPFPQDIDRSQHWLMVCKLFDLMSQPHAYIQQHCAICSDHFISEHFLDSCRNSLIDEATPALFNVQHDDQVNDDDVDFSCSVIIKEENEIASESEDEGDGLFATDLQSGQLCRLCANSCTQLLYIFNSSGKDQRIAEKINTCLPVTVNSTDPLPKQLCLNCVIKLNMCYEFAESSIQAEAKLIALNNKKHFRSKLITTTEMGMNCDLERNPKNHISHKGVKSEEKNANSKLSEETLYNNTADAPDSNGKIKESAQSYCCPLCCKGNMEIRDTYKLEGTMKLNEDSHVNITADVFKPHPITAAQLLNSDISEDGLWNEETPFEPAEELQGEAQEMFGPPPEDTVVENVKPGRLSSCRLCGATFASVELCLMHSREHTTAHFFPCGLCGVEFSEEGALMTHCEKHREQVVKVKRSKRLQCETCGRRFNSEKTLAGHSCQSVTRPHKCSECCKFFRTEARLLFHQQVHRGPNPAVCEYCGKAFSRENNLFDHVRLVHMGEKAYRCMQCDKAFQLRSRLMAHMRVHTGERPFECGVCEGKFYDNATLKGHMVTHLEVKPFQCDKCGRCFGRKTLFKQHALAHETEQVEKQTRVHSCRLCPSIGFPSHARLLEHRTEAHPGVDCAVEDEDRPYPSKPFTCDDCGKSFAYRVTLVAHRRNHTGELPFECEFCRKRFSQKRSLILHRRTHTGEKPYECSVCCKRFVQTAHLYAHMRLHTGEKPYACTVCGDKFRLKDVRDAHQRKHTGERPFKCNVCEKAFRTSHSYYQHMWIHQGKKPYPCEYCGKAFRRSNGLKIHTRIHTGEKPHACDVCGRRFAQKQDMKKHKNLHTAGKL